MTSDRVRSKDVLISRHKDLVLASNATQADTPCVLAPGNFVWPFEFELDPGSFESILGLGETFVKYDLCATIFTAGLFAKNLCAVKGIVSIRTRCLNEVNDTEPDQVMLKGTS